jgi:hypothetical protein
VTSSSCRPQIAVRRYDPARDAEGLRTCIVAQQAFHRSMEPSWPGGQAIVDDYLAHLELVGCRDCSYVLTKTLASEPDRP